MIGKAVCNIPFKIIYSEEYILRWHIQVRDNSAFSEEKAQVCGSQLGELSVGLFFLHKNQPCKT